MQSVDYYKALILEIDEHGIDLTDWEITFIASMIDRPEAWGFNERQRDKIEQIHKERAE